MAKSEILNLLICFAFGETNLAAVGGWNFFWREASMAVVQKNELTVVMNAKDLCSFFQRILCKNPSFYTGGMGLNAING
jgi:hypothetical protein